MRPVRLTATILCGLHLFVVSAAQGQLVWGPASAASTTAASSLPQRPRPAGTPASSTPMPPGIMPPAAATVDQLLHDALHLEKMGQFPAAHQRYQQALHLAPTHWRVLVSFARALHRQGRLEDAISVYRRSLQLYPQDAIAWNDLGLCLARHGDIIAAIDALYAAAQTQPSSKRYRNNLASVLIEAGRLEEAAATLIPVHGEAIAHFNLGYLLAQRGRDREACSYLFEATRRDPSLAPAQTLLSEISARHSFVARHADDAGFRKGGPTSRLQATNAESSPPASARGPNPGQDPIQTAQNPTHRLQSAALRLGADPAVRLAGHQIAVTADLPAPPSAVAPDPADYFIPGLEYPGIE